MLVDLDNWLLNHIETVEDIENHLVNAHEFVATEKFTSYGYKIVHKCLHQDSDKKH